MTLIKHSEALSAWHSIWDGIRPFPFNETIRAGSSQNAILKLYIYFKKLKETRRPEGFQAVSDIFFQQIAPFIPHHTHSMYHEILRDYFSQTKHYTPINFKTGRRFFEQLG